MKWLVAPLALVAGGALLFQWRASPPPSPAPPPAYDPLAVARGSIGKSLNLEAAVPPMCYTKTGGVSNPCWTCHTQPSGRNHKNDWDQQREYNFSEFARTNRWDNLFRDRRAEVAAISDETILTWMRQDNYRPLQEALAGRGDFRGWRPDLDLAQGFDEDGLARDGSGWRAFRYKPFPGTFWPTNGSTDDVFIRLPPRFRQSRADYLRNLEILEAALHGRAEGDYVGGAADVKVVSWDYPLHTEFLHSVRYLDPDAPGMISRRMKELRYMKKVELLDDWARTAISEETLREKDEGRLPVYLGSPETGMGTSLGWRFQGWIEDAEGHLRLQTEEEHRFCMGCHNNIGVTLDSTFSFPRKVPGKDGWRYQDLAGMKDVPQLGHSKPEVLTYFERVGGGDELRGNDEILARFFPKGRLDEALVRRAAPGGDQDLAWLLLPSRARALTLDKAYLVTVREQSFRLGRDPVVTPIANVHRTIEDEGTGLEKTKRLHRDGKLELAW
jgi:hypothetical protein